MGNFGLRNIDERDGLGAGSVAAEYEIRPAEPVGLVVGYGHALLDGDGGVSDTGNLFMGGGYVDLPTGTRLRASAAHKLRFPSLRQLYAVDGGNDDLDSERCWCYEVGVTQQLPFRTVLGVTGYWLDLKDFIERDDVSDLFENRQDLETRGFELDLVSRPWDPIFLRAGYTFLDAHDRSSGSPFDRLDNRPRHKLDGELRVRFPTDTGVRLAVSWISDTLVYTRLDPPTSHHLDSYALFDVRLDQSFLQERVRLYFGIDNLLDKESEINVAFPQPGRSFYGGFDLRY
jgi:outer membrane cobalamin receptor